MWFNVFNRVTSDSIRLYLSCCNYVLILISATTNYFEAWTQSTKTYRILMKVVLEGLPPFCLGSFLRFLIWKMLTVMNIPNCQLLQCMFSEHSMNVAANFLNCTGRFIVSGAPNKLQLMFISIYLKCYCGFDTTYNVRLILFHLQCNKIHATLQKSLFYTPCNTPVSNELMIQNALSDRSISFNKM